MIPTLPPEFGPYVLRPVVASCTNPGGGFYLLGDDGSLYAFEGAPAIRGANGQPWWTNNPARRGARLTSTGPGKVRIDSNLPGDRGYNLPVG